MKKIRFLVALVAALGLGVGTAACTSPTSLECEDEESCEGYDIGSGNLNGVVDFDFQFLR